MLSFAFVIVFIVYGNACGNVKQEESTIVGIYADHVNIENGEKKSDLKDSTCFTYGSNKGKCYNRGSKVPVSLTFYNDQYVGKVVYMSVYLECYDCKKITQGYYPLQTTETVKKEKSYGINILVPNEAEYSDKYYLRIETSTSTLGANSCSGSSAGDYFTVREEQCSGTILNMIFVLSLSLLLMI